ncbi:MAG TPA: ABC transporter permease [Chitinophagaceae bacterium]|nr:ABC transporter permease [Chitinophagaceae bacterium]
MFKNYFKTAWRTIMNNKAHSALNIFGLAMGMAVALLIGLWVQYQRSFDKFLPGHERAFQTVIRSEDNGEKNAGIATPLPMAEVMKKDIPGIKYAVQATFIGSHSLVAGDKKLYTRGNFAGEDFFKIFQFPLLQGNADNMLKNPGSIVLTQSTATALFGRENPLNKTLRIDNQFNVTVTGLIADVPANSSMKFNYIMPFSLYVQTQQWIRDNITNWNFDPIQTFVGLAPGVTEGQVAPALKQLEAKYNPDVYKTNKLQPWLQPYERLHLYGDYKNGEEAGFIDYVRMFGVIGILVLFIACINFVNLATARSEKRAKEVGIRKVAGSLRVHIIMQFLVEAVLITFMSLAIALFLVATALPAFNTLTQSSVHVPWGNAGFWGIMLAYATLTGLVAGSRPAFYLSSFRPVKVLKGVMKAGKNASLPRKVLVVAQFSCSISLIIGTAVVYRQIQYAKNRPTGFDANRLIMTDASSDIDHNYAALKNDILQTGLVSSVTKSTSPATAIYSWTGVDDWKGKNPGETLGVGTIGITKDYFETLGMHLLQGRDFTPSLTYDSTEVILNEAAVKRLRFKKPLNEVIHWNGGRAVRVIGVVKDALMGDPFAQPVPTFFTYTPGWSNSVMYRLTPTANTSDALAKLSAIFNKYNPSYPFIYHFADESYAEKFNQEVLIGRLSGIFSALAIFISCLGLFGLASFIAEQRTKEIGIRKVLGATAFNLWGLMSREFVVLVVISCLVAVPVAAYFMDGWLQQYEYRTGLSASVFIIACAGALFITLLTVSYQSLKAALMNPVKSLRSE